MQKVPFELYIPFSSWTPQCWVFDMYLFILGSFYLFNIWLIYLGIKVIFTQHASNTKWSSRQKFHQKLLPFKFLLQRKKQHEAIGIEQRAILGRITKPWLWIQLELGAMDFLVGTLCQFRKMPHAPALPTLCHGGKCPKEVSAPKWSSNAWVSYAQGVTEQDMISDASLEPKFCSSNLCGLLKSCKSYTGLNCLRPKTKCVFFCLDLTELHFISHSLFVQQRSRLIFQNLFQMFILSSDTGTLYFYIWLVVLFASYQSSV